MPSAGRALGSAPAGRHRRSRVTGWSGRATLLGVVATLAALLSSGIGIALTAAAPATTAPPAAGASATTGTGLDAAPTGARGEPRSPVGDPPRPVAEPPRLRPPAQAPGLPGGDRPDEITGLEGEVVALTNAERAAAGCDQVDADERLRTAARGHSQDMADNDYFSHTGLDGSSFVDRAQAAGYPSPAGENIAMGYRTPAEVMRGWMDSDGHRRNLLDCSHRDIGVGLAYDRDGRPYWTQVFGRG
jgi:uncharacterized protein YkwD